jgi:hypothetical protein
MPPPPRGRTATNDGATAPPAGFAHSSADFCNKIGTQSPFAALQKFGSYWGFICRAFS